MVSPAAEMAILKCRTARSGRPLAELVETITLERYKDWANYERLRRMNVEAAYWNLVRYR